MASKQLNMPLTDFYDNKYGGTMKSNFGQKYVDEQHRQTNMY